jgi:ATP-dependent RNA helicase DeaD
VLPILERLDPNDTRTQALVLGPTRELSEQVAAECHRLAANHEYRTAVFVGGRPLRPQLNALQKGVEIAIGTPGRVIDLIDRRALVLDAIKIVVLDEADRMLDIGFRPDIEKILRRCPAERQTLLLSATMPPPVERLAKRFMRDAKRVDLSEDTIMVDTIDQYYMTVDEDRKFGVLVRILAAERPQQALVFTRTKRGAERLHHRFSGKLPGVAMMNGDLPQAKRDQVMARFREGKIRLLVATDVVGRGIDVSGISHIVNYDVPEYCDDYIHRVGRTGRLSSKEKGWAITLVTREQGEQLTEIEKRIIASKISRPFAPKPLVRRSPRWRPLKRPRENPRASRSSISAWPDRSNCEPRDNRPGAERAHGASDALRPGPHSRGRNRAGSRRLVTVQANRRTQFAFAPLALLPPVQKSEF